MSGHRLWTGMKKNSKAAQETRGGDKIDWAAAKEGDPLPPRPDEIAESPDEPGVLDYDASADDGQTYSASDDDQEDESP